MQAIYVLDQYVNIHAAPNAWREKCKPVLDSAGEVSGWIIPKGTVIEGEDALFRVKTGQCEPFDEECAVAVGMSPADIEARQRAYLAASVGIKGARDLELFMAGAIEGYAPGTTDGKPLYIHGPNWSACQKAIEAEEDL